MDRERIFEIIKELDKLSEKYSDNEVIIASYISIRYGTSNFENYIDSSDLDKVFKEISNCRTLFDEELNYKIDRILNNIEDENNKYIQLCIDKVKEKQNRELTDEEIRLIKTIAPIMKAEGYKNVN